jgi:hypothetical protein
MLIAVQMAVTLAFLANSLSLIEQRLAHSAAADRRRRGRICS